MLRPKVGVSLSFLNFDQKICLYSTSRKDRPQLPHREMGGREKGGWCNILNIYKLCTYMYLHIYIWAWRYTFAYLCMCNIHMNMYVCVQICKCSVHIKILFAVAEYCMYVWTLNTKIHRINKVNKFQQPKTAALLRSTAQKDMASILKWSKSFDNSNFPKHYTMWQHAKKIDGYLIIIIYGYILWC